MWQTVLAGKVGFSVTHLLFVLSHLNLALLAVICRTYSTAQYSTCTGSYIGGKRVTHAFGRRSRADPFFNFELPKSATKTTCKGGRGRRKKKEKFFLHTRPLSQPTTLYEVFSQAFIAAKHHSLKTLSAIIKKKILTKLEQNIHIRSYIFFLLIG